MAEPKRNDFSRYAETNFEKGPSAKSQDMEDRDVSVPGNRRAVSRRPSEGTRKLNTKGRKKVRYTLRFKVIMALLVLIIAGLGYWFLPIFRIPSVNITNSKYSDLENIKEAAESLIGQHRDFFHSPELDRLKETDPYIEDIKYTRSFQGPMNIEIIERKRDYMLNSDSGSYYLDRTGKVLQAADAMEEGMILLNDDTNPMPPGNTMYMDGDKKTFLKEFRNLLDRNTSSIKFHTVDIRDMGNIRVYSGNWEIQLGNTSRLKEKLNNAVNILKTLDMNEKGEIDVRFDSPPVIRRKGGE